MLSRGGRSKISEPVPIEMIVILRMNKKFMEWARKKYA